MRAGVLVHVPRAEKIGAAVLFVALVAVAFLGLPTDTTTIRTVHAVLAPSGQGAKPAPTRVVTRNVETKESGGPPWSLLLIPGAALALGGGLYLDEQRRARAEIRDAA
jgi:hypothetical protein